jgi:hypothetical protein
MSDFLLDSRSSTRLVIWHESSASVPRPGWLDHFEETNRSYGSAPLAFIGAARLPASPLDPCTPLSYYCRGNGRKSIVCFGYA